MGRNSYKRSHLPDSPKQKMKHLLNQIKATESKIDIDWLRQMCVTKHGLINDDIRRQLWPILLNAEVITGKTIQELKEDTSWKQFSRVKHRDSDQIAKDVARSMNFFNECKRWRKEQK